MEKGLEVGVAASRNSPLRAAAGQYQFDALHVPLKIGSQPGLLCNSFLKTKVQAGKVTRVAFLAVVVEGVSFSVLWTGDSVGRVDTGEDLASAWPSMRVDPLRPAKRLQKQRAPPAFGPRCNLRRTNDNNYGRRSHSERCICFV